MGPELGTPECSDGGCWIGHDGHSYECAQKGCRHDYLCVGCTFACADCSKDFCSRHVEDMAEPNDERFAVYVCAPCAARRRDETKPTRKSPILEEIGQRRAS